MLGRQHWMKLALMWPLGPGAEVQSVGLRDSSKVLLAWRSKGIVDALRMARITRAEDRGTSSLEFHI
jgi:hypothetical protein